MTVFLVFIDGVSPFVKEVCKTKASAETVIEDLGFILLDVAHGDYYRQKDGAVAWIDERQVIERE